MLNPSSEQATTRQPSLQRQTATPTRQKKPIVRKRPRITTATPQAGQPIAVSTVTQLETDMRDVLRDWRDASGEGVTQFIGKALSDRIDKIESGSWKNYWTSMLGNTIWAAACFIDPALAPVVFGVAMTGIVISSIPGIPSPKKSSLPDIQKGLLDYLDLAYNHLNGQLPDAARKAKETHPDMGRFEAAAHFIEANFKPDMRFGYRLYAALPQLNRIAVREQMFRKALYEFDAAEAVGPAIAGITRDFAKVGPAMPGDKRTKYDGNMVVMKDDIDAVTTRYAERAGLDLTYPGEDYFDRSFPRFPGPGEDRADVPPTSYFYHWLSRKLLAPADSPKALADNVFDSLDRLPASMYGVLDEQRAKRRKFFGEVENKYGIKNPDEMVLHELSGRAGDYGIGRPYRPDLYETSVMPVYKTIIQQITDLRTQARNIEKPLDERRNDVKDIVKLPA